ncbi:hypothetical protein OSB04_007416 [Centaurea solstitialis]|uniref:Uncharacterized protein n=1 Tax=Centaurea solstitialis TaxID=347529 RepID=A0AA38TVC3_9ASTR|nr:hypothetical protein OSB04_007416 [Centaurea solstitialis]
MNTTRTRILSSKSDDMNRESYPWIDNSYPAPSLLLMSGREDSDSEAPEEFTAEQAIQKDEELRTIQKENKARVLRERKERRRTWAQKLTPRVNKSSKDAAEEIETQPDDNKGMLPDDIVKLLAANEKYSLQLAIIFFTLLGKRGLTYMFFVTGKFSTQTRRKKTPRKNQERRNPNTRGRISATHPVNKDHFDRVPFFNNLHPPHESRQSSVITSTVTEDVWLRFVLTMEPVILKEIPSPPCLQNSLDFLKKRKMAVPRSSAVLDNSSQALRFLSASGLLSKK